MKIKIISLLLTVAMITVLGGCAEKEVKITKLVLHEFEHYEGDVGHSTVYVGDTLELTVPHWLTHELITEYDFSSSNEDVFRIRMSDFGYYDEPIKDMVSQRCVFEAVKPGEAIVTYFAETDDAKYTATYNITVVEDTRVKSEDTIRYEKIYPLFQTLFSQKNEGVSITFSEKSDEGENNIKYLGTVEDGYELYLINFYGTPELEVVAEEEFQGYKVRTYKHYTPSELGLYLYSLEEKKLYILEEKANDVDFELIYNLLPEEMKGS